MSENTRAHASPLTFPQLDELVSAIERRWGPGRLPRLVSPATQAKFAKAQAIAAGTAPLWPGGSLADVPGMLVRAWQAMEAEALKAGYEPLPDGCFEIQGQDGATIVVCRDPLHVQTIELRAKAEGRTVRTWTLDEVAVVLGGTSPMLAMVNATKEAWPGAEVKRVSRPLPKDPVPFGAWGAGDQPKETAA